MAFATCGTCGRRWSEPVPETCQGPDCGAVLELPAADGDDGETKPSKKGASKKPAAEDASSDAPSGDAGAGE